VESVQQQSNMKNPNPESKKIRLMIQENRIGHVLRESEPHPSIAKSSRIISENFIMSVSAVNTNRSISKANLEYKTIPTDDRLSKLHRSIFSPPTRLQTPLQARRIDDLTPTRYFGRIECLKGLAVAGSGLGTGTGVANELWKMEDLYDRVTAW